VPQAPPSPPLPLDGSDVDEQTFDGNATLLAVGLHVSNVTRDWNDTRISLTNALSHQRLRTKLFPHYQPHRLRGYLSVMDAMESSGTGGLDLYTAHLTLVSAYPSSIEVPQFKAYDVCRDLLSTLPVLLADFSNCPSIGATVFKSPGDLIAVRALHTTFNRSIWSEAHAMDSRLKSLPLDDLLNMVGSTESKRVLLAALAQVIGINKLASTHNIDPRTIERAADNVSEALESVPAMLAQV
jgi:hypothetical protein